MTLVADLDCVLQKVRDVVMMLDPQYYQCAVDEGPPLDSGTVADICNECAGSNVFADLAACVHKYAERLYEEGKDDSRVNRVYGSNGHRVKTHVSPTHCYK